MWRGQCYQWQFFFFQEWNGPSHEVLLYQDYPLKDMWVLVEREVAAGTIDNFFIITIDALIEKTQDGDASIDDLKESVV